MTVELFEEDHPHASNWTGWVAFGAAMIMLVGTFHVLQGLVSLLDDGYYLTTADGMSVNVSFTTLGWLQIGLGVVSLLIGVGMFLGITVALVAGVIVAAVSAIVHMAAVAAYPVWSIVVIAFDVIVIYSIVAHGREMKLLREERGSPYPGEEAYIARAR
ncbi:MAG TPA: hypothetical protein VH969_19025 [Actinophytocola sp.]|jgi:hypothetical protein|uniref:DUF7144 family membrane protein n=1 Tax=Actinophytocola sp. TaxID=1872138 RepID=UPI002F921FE5